MGGTGSRGFLLHRGL